MAIVVLTAGLVGCGSTGSKVSAAVSAASIRTSMKVEGQNAVILQPIHARPGRPLVIYHHGAGANAEAPETDTLVAPTVVALLDAGYFVASSDAHGNNWGDQQALDDYQHLYDAVSKKFSTGPVVFLSQSMGGLSGLLSIAAGTIPVKAWAGIYPVVSLSTEYSMMFKNQIDGAYGIKGGDFAKRTAGHDPAVLPASSFRNVPMEAWASYGDTMVPRSRNSDALVKHQVANLTLLTATGDHGDPSHFHPADVVAFFDAHI